MRVVGVRELKNRLSEYLRAVKRGERVLVTDRGQVIAELREPAAYPEQSVPPGLAAMVRDNALQVGLPNTADAYPPQPPRVADGTAAQVIDELRGEG
jgi:antitoxin (DNA-binding transcriptional repressor) of toxin-antitoxin stability system